MMADGKIVTAPALQRGIERHLIRAGWIVLGATLLGWIGGEWSTWIGYGASAVLLIAGYRLAWEHKQVRALAQIIARRTKVSATELQENLGLSAALLAKRVRTLNRDCDPAAPMFVVWDQRAGWLENRLADRGQVLHITTCPQCKAQVDCELHAELDQLPQCAFCGAVLGEAEWRELTGGAKNARARSRAHPKFHVAIFVALLIVLPIPIALLYAAWTTGILDQVFGELRQHLNPHRA